MKKMISVHVSEEKLSAIEMYLGQKNTALAAELDKFIEQLYIKTVPQNVRDFIDMMSEKKPPRKSKAMQESEKIIAQEQ